MYEVLSPALSAIRNSQMLMTSTAGFSDSVVLRSTFDRSISSQLAQSSMILASWVSWWRAESDDIALDRESLARANPALDGPIDEAGVP